MPVELASAFGALARRGFTVLLRLVTKRLVMSPFSFSTNCNTTSLANFLLLNTLTFWFFTTNSRSVV